MRGCCLTSSPTDRRSSPRGHGSVPSADRGGSGDIAPAVAAGGTGADTAASSLLLGIIVGLIAIIVVATVFITAEYRRGLIRTTFIAVPYRQRVLAAKAVVIGSVAFVTGAVAAAIAIPLGEHVLAANGNYVFPANLLTEVRVIVGVGAALTNTAIAALALGTVVRKSVGAVTADIIVFALPYVLGSAVSSGAEQWLFRLTPAAGFAVLQALPRSAQADYPYALANGYYPIAPWAGLLVMCAYAAVALAVAAYLLNRRDA